MKNVLFMLINMNVGGTEKSLLNMLTELPREKYNITILLLEEYGDYLNLIPKHINVEFFSDYKKLSEYLNNPPKIIIKEKIKQNQYFNAIILGLVYGICKIKKQRGPLFRYILRKHDIREIKYDLAVAYAGPMDFITYYVNNKINAKKKAQWIHFDINKIGFNINFAKKYYKSFDKIFCVSNEAKEILIKNLPKFQKKYDVFKNILSAKLIQQEANQGDGFKDNFEGIRILTVGRICKQKGQDIIPEILKKLINSGHKVRWYCIGTGNLEDYLVNKIKEFEVEEDLILLGQQLNPYPYYKNCDIYVQPSRYEGFCITLAEAKIFNKPIIITDFVGSEQIIDNETGLIAKFDKEELYKSIKKLLDNDSLRKKFNKNLRSQIVDTSIEINKLINIIQ